MQLTGNDARLNSGASTSSAQVNYHMPFTGAYEILFGGNNHGRTRLHAANAFTRVTTSGESGPGEQNFILEAHAAGALGTGDVTIESTDSLEIHAANTMYDMAVLYLNGLQSGNSDAKLVLHADEIVRNLFVGGDQQPAGIYDAGSGLVDASGQPLISGSGELTVLQGPDDDGTMQAIHLRPVPGTDDVRQGDQLEMIFQQSGGGEKRQYHVAQSDGWIRC